MHSHVIAASQCHLRHGIIGISALLDDSEIIINAGACVWFARLCRCDNDADNRERKQPEWITWSHIILKESQYSLPEVNSSQRFL